MHTSQRDRILLLLGLLMARTTVIDAAMFQEESNEKSASRRSLLSQLSNNEKEQQRDLIVGGKQARPGDFPYYVHLMKCGGSLISPRVVLTAAHCGEFVGHSAYVGCHEYGEATGDAVVRVVQDQLIHPDYDSTAFANDFNLLLLNETVTLEAHTDIVLTLNEDDLLPADGQEVTVLGLGLLEEDGEVPDYVRYVQVEKTADEYCNTAYGGDIEDSVQFCAGVEGGGKDACQGDSGGPLVVEYGNQHVQVGVVSSGTGCADPDYPGIYARVSGQMDWIKQVVCNDWNQTDATFCPNYVNAQTGRSFTIARSQPPNWYRIQSKVNHDSNEPHCLSLENGYVATNGEAVVMLPCDGTYQQQWTQFDNDYLIRSKMNPNKCLTVKEDDETFELWDCFDNGKSLAFEAWSDGTIRLKDDSTKCWEYSSTSMDKAILTDCADTTVLGQEWKTTLRQDDLLRAKNVAKEALETEQEEQRQETKSHVKHAVKSVATSLESKIADLKDIRDSSTTTANSQEPRDTDNGNDEEDNSTTWFGLKNVKTDTCLTLEFPTATDLTIVTLEDCDSDKPEQQWQLMESGEIQTKLNTSKCVVPSGDGEMGDAILVYECSGETVYGQWEIPAFDDIQDAIGPIVSKEDGNKCLASHTVDNVVVLGQCPTDEAHIRNDRLWEIV